MRSTTVKRQEALGTGVSATGTEEEGGEGTARYFRIFSRYIGDGDLPGGGESAGREIAIPPTRPIAIGVPAVGHQDSGVCW